VGGAARAEHAGHLGPHDVIRVHGAGCALIDNIYDDVDFTSATFRRYASRRAGDGGLVPGQLVFAEDLASFAGVPYSEVLRSITGRSEADHYNVGGPAIVPLVHAAQMLAGTEHRVAFSGLVGADRDGGRIRDALFPVPIDLSAYRSAAGATPSTDVLSDPRYDSGRGERTFINQLGVAADPGVADFSADFFSGDIVFFGGTALVPPVHDSLTDLTRRARSSGAYVVVGTVYDFRNEKRAPGAPWPLVDDYTAVDLVVTDREEALRISGCANDASALEWFIDRGAGAAVITRGPEPVLYRSEGPATSLPICDAVAEKIRQLGRGHDTTGCGDNFAGGMLTSLALQKADGTSEIDLTRAVAEGVVAGGLAATYLGGLYHESAPGEKRDEINRLREAYRAQRRGGRG
jgi:sugar/nucleoside kinase (ribokinase family)